MTKVGVTGSSGFVGSSLVRRLRELGVEVVTVGRIDGPDTCTTYDKLIGANAGPQSLMGCNAILHLGARVHVMREAEMRPLEAYRKSNVHTTIAFARAAVTAGVRRFIFVSSVKVNGEHTDPGVAFRHGDPPNPKDPYGISKREAEDGLREIARQTGMELVIVRPPLVYGPGVKANFAAMMRAIDRGLPIPLGRVTHNRRSFVALDNLVDLLITCIAHPAATNQTFLVSDGEDLSTTELLRRMGQALGKSARLLPVPPTLLKLGAATFGKGDVAQRLLGNLQVDITHTQQTLGWTPLIGVDEGLRRAAAGMEHR